MVFLQVALIIVVVGVICMESYKLGYKHAMNTVDFTLKHKADMKEPDKKVEELDNTPKDDIPVEMLMAYGYTSPEELNTRKKPGETVEDLLKRANKDKVYYEDNESEV